MFWKLRYHTLHLVDSDDWESVTIQYGKAFWLGLDGMYVGIAYTPDYQEQQFTTMEEAKAWVKLMAKLTRT